MDETFISNDSSNDTDDSYSDTLSPEDLDLLPTQCDTNLPEKRVRRKPDYCNAASMCVETAGEELTTSDVLVCTSSVLRRVLDEGMMEMPNINVLIIDSCHLIWIDEDMQHIMKLYKQCDEDKKPRILALTHPIFASNKNSEENVSNDKSKDCKEATTENEKCVMDSECKAENDGTEEKIDCDKRKTCANTIGAYENQDDYDMYEKLEWKIEELEEKLCCQMDLAEDIDGGKSRDSIYRLSALVGKPKELIIEYDAQKPMDELSEDYLELDRYMRQTISDAIE
ncbi:hypothetical protein ACJJTC_003321, partial [Scirpophaga incertulas]